MTAYTKRLAEHCAEIRFQGLSSETIQHTKYLFLDFIGNAAKGLSLESTQNVHSFIKRVGGQGDGTIIGGDLRPLPQYAAFANASSSHAMSLDDIYTPASIHPGSGIFAAALATAEWTAANGERFVEGIVAGYEATIRIANAVGSKDHYALGWHPTATCGTFGATAVVSRILDINPTITANAFGIAGSMSAGSMAFLQDGSWTKRIHPGLASQRGIQAALLAAEGFRGPQTILEGKNGFLQTTSRTPNYSRLIEKIGGRPLILDTGLKLHACCRYNQSAIDAVLFLRKSNDLNLQKIDSIQVETFQAAFPLVIEPWEQKMNPKTDVQAQFSLPYTVAIAVLKGRVSFEEFFPNHLVDPNVRNLMKKVNVIHNPEFDIAFPKSWPTRVKIRTTDGKEIENKVDFPKGDVENPLSWDELIARFKEHSQNVFRQTRQDKIIEAIQNLEKQEDMQKLTALLRIKKGR